MYFVTGMKNKRNSNYKKKVEIELRIFLSWFSFLSNNLYSMRIILALRATITSDESKFSWFFIVSSTSGFNEGTWIKHFSTLQIEMRKCSSLLLLSFYSRDWLKLFIAQIRMLGDWRTSKAAYFTRFYCQFGCNSGVGVYVQTIFFEYYFTCASEALFEQGLAALTANW